MSARGFPRKVLMTLDAVGGVWRYAMSLATGLSARGTEVVLVGLGPEPAREQAAEARRAGKLLWLNRPLDWMVRNEAELSGVAPALQEIARRENVDLLHLNLPSQAVGLGLGAPVVTVSHSCVATWFHAVRDEECPPEWRWQKRRNQEGFTQSDAVVAPSSSHAAMLEACYGAIPQLSVAYNASAQPPRTTRPKQNFVLAAGRWWDEGKNGATLDEAAPCLSWPVRMAGPTRGPNGEALRIVHAESLGSLSFAAMAGLMGEAGIFCSPSLYEPFGLAALEAAQAGAAMVLADIPTYRELWEGAALFADPRDPGALGGAVTRLIGDKALRRELGARAQNRSGDFAIDAQAEAMLRIYGAVRPRNAARVAG